MLRGPIIDGVLNTALDDIHMLAINDGAERSAQQWQLLLHRAAFALRKLTRTHTP